jgi:hypothetical protein
MPDLRARGRVLRAQVPEGIFTLAIEADDVAAAAEHAAFADRCQPLLLHAVGGDAEEATWLRAELISQLDAMRGSAAAAGLGYLGALAGNQGGHPVMILLGITATPFAFPTGIDPASLLAAMLRGQYPGASVEEFDTACGVGVGIRRCEEAALPAPANQPVAFAAGISQALVPFPEAGLLGTVTGFCYSPTDIDVATVFTATIAHHMTVVPDELAAGLSGGHSDGDKLAVAGVQQAAARSWWLANNVAREPHANQVSLRQCRGRGQAATARPFGFDLPAAEADADAFGFPGENQRSSGISPEGDQAAQLIPGVAIAQHLGVVDQYHARSAEGAKRCCQLFPTKRRRIERLQDPRCTGEVA